MRVPGRPGTTTTTPPPGLKSARRGTPRDRLPSRRPAPRSSQARDYRRRCKVCARPLGQTRALSGSPTWRSPSSRRGGRNLPASVPECGRGRSRGRGQSSPTRREPAAGFRRLRRLARRAGKPALPGAARLPHLGEEGEGKARGQTEAVFAIAAALIESQFQIGGQFRLRRKEGKVCISLKYSRRRWNYGHAAQAAVRQPQPLLF